MIEQWCARGWSKGIPAAARVLAAAQQMRLGVWLFLALMLLVLGRRSLSFYEQHAAHRAEIVEAIGSVGFFYGPPQPDLTGSRVLYLRTSENGLGLYAADVASGSTIMLKEWKPEPGRSLRGQALLPLSPDGKFLPLVVSIEASPAALAICDAESGDELTRIQSPGWLVTDAAWVTAGKLAWLRKNRPGGRRPPVFELHLAERQANGAWTDKAMPLRQTNVLCLAAMAENAVAWADDGGIQVLNLLSNSMSTLFTPDVGAVAGMTYSRERREFLVTCGGTGRRSLWRLSLGTNDAPELSRLTTDKHLRFAQWLNQGKGFAYVRRHTLVVKSDGEARSVPVNAAVETLTATPEGERLFFIGSTTNEPGLGLWRYEAGRQLLSNVVRYSDHPSQRARRVEPVHCTTKLDGGRSLSYYVYRPVNFSRHKRYPMLIGDTLFGQFAYQRDFDGPSWAEAMANCGAYVVIAERQTWFPKDNQEWRRGVMTLYQQLKDEPSIDHGRVFLFGVSVETQSTSQLLVEQAGLWKGVVFMNPGGLPDLSAFKAGGRLPRILISAGEEEGELERFKRFREEGCARGVLVEFVEHANASHVLTSIPATRERILRMRQFVFEE